MQSRLPLGSGKFHVVVLAFIETHGSVLFVLLSATVTLSDKKNPNRFCFCSISLKFQHDEAGLLRNRFDHCRYVVVINTKVIHRSEVREEIIFAKPLFGVTLSSKILVDREGKHIPKRSFH